MMRARLPVGMALIATAVPALASVAPASAARASAPASPTATSTATDSLGSLALTLTTNPTTVTSGADVRATLVVLSTGTQAATAVTACLAPPPQLSVAQATGAQRKGRRVCFSMGDLPAGTEHSRAVTLRAVADRTVNVRLAASASSTCRCSARPYTQSPVIRIVRAAPTPRVTG